MSWVRSFPGRLNESVGRRLVVLLPILTVLMVLEGLIMGFSLWNTVLAIMAGFAVVGLIIGGAGFAQSQMMGHPERREDGRD